MRSDTSGLRKAGSLVETLGNVCGLILLAVAVGPTALSSFGVGSAAKAEVLATNAPCLKMREDPNVAAQMRLCIADGEAVNLSCHVHGQKITGPGADTDVWYRATYRGEAGLVSGAYLRIAQDKAASVPLCEGQ